MITPRPFGVQEGRMARGAHRDAYAAAKEFYVAASARCKLPLFDYIFTYELRQVQQGNRWAPAVDDDAWEEAVLMCKTRNIDRVQRQQGPRGSELLDSRYLFEKFSMVLHYRGEHPLVKPRRGHYHTEIYMVYCGMMGDPENFSGWKFGSIYLTPAEKQITLANSLRGNYVPNIYVFKTHVYNILCGLGLDTRLSSHHNKITMITKLSLTINKNFILRDRYPNRLARYQGFIDTDVANRLVLIRRLARRCFRRRTGAANLAMNRAQHQTAFENTVWYLACFEPLYGGYADADFPNFAHREAVLVAYHNYLVALAAFRNAHQRAITAAHEESVRRNPREARRRLLAAGVDEEDNNDDDDSDGNLPPTLPPNLGGRRDPPPGPPRGGGGQGNGRGGPGNGRGGRGGRGGGANGRGGQGGGGN